MSYSADPVLDAHRYYSELDKAADLYEQAEQQNIDAFIATAKHGDANRLVAWAGLTTDWTLAKRPIDFSKDNPPKRLQSLSEVMVDSLDYRNGPDMSEAMQLLLNVAFGNDLVNQPARARHLIERMAQAWASFNTEAE